MTLNAKCCKLFLFACNRICGCRYVYVWLCMYAIQWNLIKKMIKEFDIDIRFMWYLVEVAFMVSIRMQFCPQPVASVHLLHNEEMQQRNEMRCIAMTYEKFISQTTNLNLDFMTFPRGNVRLLNLYSHTAHTLHMHTTPPIHFA